MEHRRSTAILAVLVAGWVTACGAVAPTPSASLPSASDPPTPRRTPSASAAAPTDEPSASEPATGLRAEIEIKSIDPALTHPVLEFVSTSHSILFSSGVAEDAAPDAAPDLWRLEPPSEDPELVWRNPNRDHSIVKMAGDLDVAAFVDIPTDGSREWTLYLIPARARDPIVLDEHPGDEEVSSLVPSFGITEGAVVWTAFDRGSSGPVSQLLMAQAPSWEPRVLLERLAAEAELWLPSLNANHLVFTEVRYNEDRTADERRVYLLDPFAGSGPRRLDTSGRATMPLVWDGDVIWKEADPGFNMFNWGRMFRYDLATDELSTLPVWPQEYVNYPSLSGRFAAWWGADSAKFGVYDLETNQPGLIEMYTADEQAGVLRPHVAGDLLVWLYFEEEPEAYSELRYTFLPIAGGSRLD